MHFINAILKKFALIKCILINVDVNSMHAILQHCYFKAASFISLQNLTSSRLLCWLLRDTIW